MSLPENLDKIFHEELKEYEKERQMPYITSAERIGREEGRKEGRVLEKKANLLSFVHNSKKQGIPIETIAKIVKLNKDLIKKILNNDDIEIALHLLEPNE